MQFFGGVDQEEAVLAFYHAILSFCRFGVHNHVKA